MASVQERMIEEKVEAKKEMLHIHNSFANRNADLFREKVFCLCTVCSVLPIMTRNVLTNKGTAY